MKKKKKNDASIAAEPQLGYGKEIVFFKSFEEMNEYDYKDMAKNTPVESLQHITYSLQHMFAEELKKEMDLVVHFK